MSTKKFSQRQKAWNPAKWDAPRYPRSVLAKFAHTVTSASLGAVTDVGLNL